ncbi:phosphate ABC transporter permease subunit PstC [Haloarchaeobius sp. DFWS5]|uniref:phosphate ABC transporter permease subunit PstC n=1 Tax=Haloarchaeobius sp. DFWS5 TaxID=3446114 RepID=UPI003EBA1DC4
MFETVQTRAQNLLSQEEQGAFVVWGLMFVTLLVTFAGFVLQANWTAFPLLAFAVTVVYGWFTTQAATVKGLAFITTIATVTILGLITVFLFLESLPAWEEHGFDLLYKSGPPYYQPTSGIISLTPMIWGTIAVTFVATLVAGPLGIAGALFVSEIAPAWAREIVKPGIELMAGIPSIVYGFIGWLILSDYMRANLNAAVLGGSLFLTGLVVGIMALPTVVSVAEDALSSVPDSMKDGSVAVGATEWQTMGGITVPAAFSGVSAAVLLGVGRAVGETMAATVILAHSPNVPKPLYDFTENTEALTSLIAFNYGNAGEMELSALFFAGVLLFVTVLFISIGSQLIERRMKAKLGGNE